MADKSMSNLDFRFMTLLFKLRDLLKPRMNTLKEVGIKPGFSVLDYGCGPGGNMLSLARLVGASGKIYALDIHPLAVQMVRGIALRKRLTNVETIQSNCKTGLPDSSIDAALLYDVFHDLSDPRGVLEELNRILKSGGVLSVNDHHMQEAEIVGRITDGGLFHLSKKGEKTYGFMKAE
ncbi:MAG TPA: methyltransferase domain-containing protein [Dehalococcoidales bacterium]|nr:methyltransferase domain-containing protein [Dehalococcoidales bacterium]